MAIKRKDGSTWKTASNAYYKRGSSWVPLAKVWTKVSGVWKQVFQGKSYSWKIGTYDSCKDQNNIIWYDHVYNMFTYQYTNQVCLEPDDGALIRTYSATATVTCIDENGATVADSKCPQPPPSGINTCTYNRRCLTSKTYETRTGIGFTESHIRFAYKNVDYYSYVVVRGGLHAKSGQITQGDYLARQNYATNYLRMYWEDVGDSNTFTCAQFPVTPTRWYKKRYYWGESQGVGLYKVGAYLISHSCSFTKPAN